MKKQFIGVISDTHGLLRPAAVEALTGAWLILHAGDIGKPEVLEALRQVAPLVAIRGNVDRGWASELPERESLEILGRRTCLVHDIKTLDLDPAGNFDLVVYGHSHKPECRRRDGVFYMNPGSAGPRRFKLPVTLGRLYFKGDSISGEVIELPL